MTLTKECQVRPVFALLAGYCTKRLIVYPGVYLSRLVSNHSGGTKMVLIIEMQPGAVPTGDERTFGPIVFRETGLSRGWLLEPRPEVSCYSVAGTLFNTIALSVVRHACPNTFGIAH